MLESESEGSLECGAWNAPQVDFRETALILGDNDVDEEGFFVLPTPGSALRHDFWIYGLIGLGDGI